MANRLMDILVILDRSGSMMDARKDHEGGLRSFVREQKELEGDVRFTLVQFDTTDPCEIVFDRVRIQDVDEDKIQLVPRGGTPLLDAVGKATSHLLALQAKEAADETVVMVITDGEENESREWDTDKVKARIKEMEQGTAKFLYLGANVDAFHEATNVLGMGGHVTIGATGMPQHSHSVAYAASPASVGGTYAALSANVSRVRTSMLRSSGHTHTMAVNSLVFTDEQREAIDQAAGDCVHGTTTDGDDGDVVATTTTSSKGEK